MDLDSVVVDGNRESRERVLHLVSGAADGDAGRLYGAGFLPLLCILGSDAGTDVSADWHMGRAAEALRGDQVLPLHPGWLSADAARHSVPVFPPSHPDWRLHVQPASALRVCAEDLFRFGTVCRHAALLELLLCICDQGADVPIPYVAAGRARGSPDGGIGDSGGRPAEDGDVRIHPLLTSLLPGCARAHESSQLDDCSVDYRNHLWRARFEIGRAH